MRTRTIWIGVVAATAVGIGAILWAGRGGSGPTPRPTPDDGGRVIQRQRPQTIQLAGEVLDETGLPVQGATVYVLDKDRPGADRDKIDHEVTDALGQWRLRTRKAVGCWIGVVAPGYRTALLDGDGVDPARKLIHVVTRSPSLTVTIVDRDGTPMAEKGVQLSPWPPGGTYFCPGPLCRQGEQWAVTDAEGRCTFRQDVAAPVVVRPFIDGFHGHPRQAWLPDAAGTLEIAVHPNASLEVLLTQGGAPLTTDELVTLELFEADADRPAFAFTQTVQADGRMVIDRSVVPGTYHLRVGVPGRPSVLVQGLTVGEAGDTPVRTTVAVPPPATGVGSGSLRVRLEGNKAATPIRGRHRAPLTFLQRTDGAWAELGWRPGAPTSYDPTRQRLAYELEPGTYRLLVADVLTGRAALEAGIEVRAGAARDLVLPMTPGQYGSLPPAREEGIYVRRLETRTPDGLGLPVFGSSRSGRQRFSRGIDLLARKIRGEDVVIGPYPLDAFAVVLHRSDGSRKTAQYN